jgi:hypothetical protein
MPESTSYPKPRDALCFLTEVFRVSLRILFVFCDTRLAAEFHFLIAVDFGHGITHGAESVSADDACVRGVAFDSGVAGSGAGSESCPDERLYATLRNAYQGKAKQIKKTSRYSVINNKATVEALRKLSVSPIYEATGSSTFQGLACIFIIQRVS